MRVQPTTEEQSSNFELAKAGKYGATITEVEHKTGPAGQYAVLSIQLNGVEFNANGEPLKGNVGKVWDNCTLIDGKRWRICQAARAAGLDPADFDTEELSGKEVQVQIDVEKSEQYSPRNVVKRYVEQ